MSGEHSRVSRPPVWAALGLATLAGCAGGIPGPAAFPTTAGPDAAGMFQDVTAASGVDHTYRNGEEAGRYAILESLGGGVAVLDFDGDGLLDLYFPGGGSFEGPDGRKITGRAGRLYRNLGGWKFRDVTAEAGLDHLAGGADWFYSHGAAVADYDRDGWPDLLVTGYGRVALFHNEPDGKGGRRFADVSRAAGLLGPHFWATSAAWGDLDGDGFPDLYVCQYVNWSNHNDPACTGYRAGVPRDICAPGKFDSRPHALYRNKGDGTFEDVTRSCGLRCDRPDREYGKGLGVLFVDVDGDGRPDVYVANDTTDNFLYLNRSTPGRIRIEERGLELGVARDDNGVMNGSMGVDAADFDGGGRPSLWVTNYENEFHGLYRNRSAGGRLLFNFHTAAAGLGAVGPNFVGFGTAFLDVDGDGWEDLVVSNGHVMRHAAGNSLRQRPILFRNTPRGKDRFFVDASAEAGEYFGTGHRGRGLAVADLDNDGRPDLVLAPVGERAALLRNAAAPARNWLGVEPAGEGGRDVVGARLTLKAGGRTLVRFAKGGGSYLSSGDRRVLFGLGDAAEAGRLTVEWPTGAPRVEHFDGLKSGRYHRVRQGGGRP